MTTPGVSWPADAAQIAARLTKARADRIAITPVSAEFPGFDLAAGYAVQRHLRAEAGPLAGWKLGLTSRAKQAQVGVHEPVLLSGGLTAAVWMQAGDVVAVAADRLGSVEIACR